MRRLKKALIGVPAAALLMVATAGSAQADDGYSSCVPASNDAGGDNCVVDFYNESGRNVSSMDFHASGEHMYLSDYYADGRGIVAEIGSLSRWWANTSGANTTIEVPLPDIEEGRTIAIKVCQTNDGSWINCVTVYPTA